jgi:hypothetical protein
MRIITIHTISSLLGLVLFAPVAVPLGRAADSVPPPPARLTAEQDHQRIMGLLNITSLRNGANGNNPLATNAANTDESTANPYPNLPDPLTLKNGRKVTTAAMWWDQRRPEIVEDFDREIYGRVPAKMPAVTWKVTSANSGVNGNIPVITKTLAGHVDNSAYTNLTVDIALTLTLPANATGPSPVMMVFGAGGGGFGGPVRGGRGGPGGTNGFGGTNGVGRGGFAGAAPGGTNAPGGRGGGFGGGFGGGGPDWHQTALSNGWGYASLSTASIQADSGAGLTLGIIGLANNGQPRKVDDWGVLRAWAWGASRALDYLETDKAVNARAVGLEGHSRWGKATLVAMAYDQRFAIAYVSSSGEGGAKLHRRNWGELVENIAGTGEYHWMAGNFLKYAGPLTWNDLPVDSHELIALCAPRPVFISAGSTNGDSWVDAKGMFLAAAGAGPVYKLLGKKEMGTAEFPPMETPLTDGEVAFRQHSGGHTDIPNWPTFLKFAARYIQGPALAPSQPANAGPP